jgi:hypothetical protein
MKECPELKAAQRFAAERRKQRKEKKLDLSAEVEQLRREVRQLRNQRPQKAYVAEDQSDGPDTNPELSGNSDECVEETAALSKDAARKVPRSSWIVDTAATSHMTDQLHLFSRALIPIKRRTIRVGGGLLYADLCGSVRMEDRHGNSIILNPVLYVPTLGANLLSTRRMCQKGLKGEFNFQTLYMRDPRGRMVIEAHDDGGVYVVEKIQPEFKDIALVADVCNEPKLTTPNLKASSNLTEVALPAVMPKNPGTAAEPQQSMPEVTLDNQGSIDIYKLWHRRFAHLGSEKLRNLHKVTTLEKPIPVFIEHDSVCEVCALTKFRNRHSQSVSDRKTSVLALVSIDICGPLPRSHAGYTYFLVIVDNYSRKLWVIPLKRREDTPQVLQEWRVKAELQSGTKLLAVRSDNATELKAILDKWCVTIGIVPQYTVPYMSSQNGVAERAIQTVENSVRAMIKDAELPIEFWAEAAETDAYLRNRTNVGPEIEGKPTCPEEAFTGTQPSIDHVRVWGCKAYSYVDPRSLPALGRRDKFVDRGRVGVFVGYVDETPKQYKIWAPDLGRVMRSHAVTFMENEKGGSVDLKLRVQQTPNTLPERRPVGRPPLRREPVETSTPEPVTAQEAPPAPKTDEPDQDSSQENPSAEEPVEEVPPPSERPKPARIFSHILIPKRKREDEDTSYEEPDAKIPRSMIAMLANTIQAESYQHKLPEVQVFYALKAQLEEEKKTKHVEIPTPRTYAEAIEDPVWGEIWKEAIQTELRALAANGTWEEVVPPKGANIVTSKWVFKPKLNLDGSLERAKARLVARGFSQILGVDYYDTFAPTVRHDTLRTFLALVALEDLELHQVDVNNAFTESSLKEDIYMKPPSGVTVKPGRVLRVLRSLYGLKQAARDWNKRCITELLGLGFRQSTADPCLLLHDERKIMLLLYVDDASVAAPHMDDINWFKNAFGKIFKIKDLGETDKILGIRISRDRKRRTLRIDQSHYLKEILEEFHMEQDRARVTKLPLNGYDALRPAGPNDVRIDPREYQQAVGKLMYLATLTRPDISFALGKLSQFLSDPAEHHGQALKGLMRYLRSNPNLGITFRDSGSPDLIGYSDSDYAMDKTDRKSTLGYVFMLGNGPIAWISRKQKSVATSTAEAEYIAMSTAAKESQWLAHMLRDMGFAKYIGQTPYCATVRQDDKHRPDIPVQLRGDNQAALTLVKDAQVHERSKHIDVAYHFVQDLYRRNRINVEFVRSNEMVADGLTKPLVGEQFKRFIEQLRLQRE